VADKRKIIKTLKLIKAAIAAPMCWYNGIKIILSTTFKTMVIPIFIVFFVCLSHAFNIEPTG